MSIATPNRRLVLDYSDSVSDSSWGPLTKFVGPKRSAFFSKPGWCPYCKGPAPIILDENRMWQPEDSDDPCLEEFFWAQVWACPTCGWWDLFESESSGHDSIDPPFVSETVRHGVLRSYDIGEAKIPISSLRAALRKKREVNLVNPKVLEGLVASVLEDFFPNCIARVCGRSHDHGIDLVVVESDHTIAVQVKRRERNDAVESVSPVREFLGASLVEGFEDLMYVSTADHFSAGHASAEELAATAVDRRIVRSFALIDRHRLLKMLDLVPREPEEPWRNHLPPIFLAGGR